MRKLNFTIITILTILIIIIVNYIGYKYYKTFDLSQNKRFTLSEKTEVILDNLESSLKIYVILNNNSVVYPRVKELLDLYKSYNFDIKLEYFNPVKDYNKIKDLSYKYEISENNVIILEYNKNIKYIYENDIVELEFDYNGIPEIKYFFGEQVISSNIKNLTNNRIKKVYFSTGHNEIKLNQTGKLSINYFQKLLRMNNFNVEKIYLSSIDKIPEDCSLFIIAAPLYDFTEKEINLLSDFINNNGKIIFALEQLNEQKKYHNNLNSFFNELGVSYENNYVIEQQNLKTKDNGIKIIKFSDNVITKALKQYNIPLILDFPSEIKVLNDTNITELFRSSKNSFLTENNSLVLLNKYNESAVNNQSYLLTVLIEESEDTGFKVFISDASIIYDNRILNKGNNILIQNLIDYMTESEHLISLPPESMRNIQLTLTNDQLFTIFIYVLIILPLIVITTGILVWLRRRK